MKTLLFILILAVAAWTTWKNLTLPKNVGTGKLAPCPSSPNCVSSRAADVHRIPPLPYRGKGTLSQIQTFLRKRYSGEVLREEDSYLHVVVKTPYLRFRDDLEFLVDQEEGQIEVRSASRVGYSDLGTNRKRIEALRHFLLQDNVE